jgi:AMP deaminase
MELKRHWLGQHWYLPGAAGNDIHKTNVPNIRLQYRHQTLLEELALVSGKSVKARVDGAVALPTAEAVARATQGVQ